MVEASMATEFESGAPIRRDDNEPRKAFRQSRHWSTYVILALLAVVIVAGMVLTLGDDRSDSGTGTTVGSTAQAPPPAPVNRP
jgi:hypothetical protein